jgi:hypothetical protein
MVRKDDTEERKKYYVQEVKTCEHISAVLKDKTAALQEILSSMCSGYNQKYVGP